MSRRWLSEKETVENGYLEANVERSLSTDTGMSFFLPRIVGYSRACDIF